MDKESTIYATEVEKRYHRWMDRWIKKSTIHATEGKNGSAVTKQAPCTQHRTVWRNTLYTSGLHHCIDCNTNNRLLAVHLWHLAQSQSHLLLSDLLAEFHARCPAFLLDPNVSLFFLDLGLRHVLLAVLPLSHITKPPSVSLLDCCIPGVAS